MGVIVKPKTWADNENVTYTDINSNFDTVYNEFNGNIEDANIDASAAIAVTKISGTAVNLSSAQSISGKKTFASTVGTITADSDAATITFNMTTSNLHSVTLGGNRTLAVSNLTAGQSFVLILKQDGTGSRTVTWFVSPGSGTPAIKWVGAAAPTLTTTASRADIFAFLYDGTDIYGSVVGQNYG